MSLGIGLGAFVQGLSGGLGMGQNIAQMRDRAAARTAAQEAVTETTNSRNAEIKGVLQRGAIAPSAEGEAPAWSVGGQTTSNLSEAQKAAEREVGSFVDHYMRVGAPRVMEQMVASGDTQRAAQFGQWIRQEGTQRGLRSWAGMIRAAHSGDADGFLTHARAAYNNEEYAPDGQTVTAGRVIRGENNSVEGMELTFQGRDGSTRTQRFNGAEDLYRAGVAFMAPEQVQRFALGELAASRSTRERLAAEDRGERRLIEREDRAEGRTERAEFRGEVRTAARDDATERRQERRDTRVQDNALERANEAARLKAAQPPRPRERAPEDVRRSLETIRNNLASTDMAFSRLTPDQQASRVRAVYEQQERDAAAVTERRTGATTPPPGAIPVYRPPAGGRGVNPP